MAVSLQFYNKDTTFTEQLKSVILLVENLRMREKFLFILACIYLAFSNATFADVLIDLDNATEISISNTRQTANYTFKLEEPVLQNNSSQSALNTTNHNNINGLPYHSEVMLAAQETAIAPALIHAMITVESRHNAKARSKKGAYGLMQLMPNIAQRFNVNDKNDPSQNILAGAKYMRELLTLFNGDLNLSLAAYNAGPAAVQKYGGKVPPYNETLNYVPKVLKYYQQYS